jgi:glycine cleavage system protein P-like pyridoxal-binding family
VPVETRHARHAAPLTSDFPSRHIGPDASATERMLGALGYDTLDQLIDAAVPDQIRSSESLDLPAARSEQQVLGDLRTLSERNETRVQMIGLGYSDTITPAVLRRNMLESPAWYTAYTPYQPEISQGRLEALLTFQTVIEDLTALPLAGASLLDEATAVVEAVLLMRRANKAKSSTPRVVVDADCLPQTLAVVCGRAKSVGIEVEVADLTGGLPDGDLFGVVFQAPGASGQVRDLAPLIAAAKERGALTTVAADLLSLTLLTPPGEQGADIAVGSAQRFGVPLFFGGPHAGYMAVRDGLERMLPGRLVDADHVAIACDECTTDEIVDRVLSAFGAGAQAGTASGLPQSLLRTSNYLRHNVFHEHRSETAMLRFLRALSDKDLALDRTMIPLGSCTMKLNSAVEMEPISWPGFASIHPYAPVEQTSGYLQLIRGLERWLSEITGYDRVSLQPNAGSQGELAGLLAINGYHESRGDLGRDICLIPQSAHGTNAASAVLAGMRVVVVATASNGNIDLDDLRAKIAAHEGTIAAIMLTYPSTHGVYENDVRTVCDLVHEAGGQVYVDGANLNALVGLAQPGKFGGDVSHLNLHKTFCIPHGGGGPGVGPVAVRKHLAPFLPGNPLGGDQLGTPVSAANYGSAGILPITWAYIALMGPDGLTEATKTAVLAANYVAKSLDAHFPVLYTGPSGLVAHECILDLRPVTKATGVTAEDVAKRLIDYGFHAPTLSFPVNGTLMVEPTESEDLAELDRFIEAMISIRREIDLVGEGVWPLERSPLRQAPHTAEQVTADTWDLPYPRHLAAFPVASLRGSKYWPPVRRIDGVHGDRNLVCSCPAPEAFENTTDIDSPAIAETPEEAFA